MTSQRDGEEALAPCPFCGGADAFVERADFSSCYVICNDCGARGPTSCDENDTDATASESGECEPGELPARRLWGKRAFLPDATEQEWDGPLTDEEQGMIDRAWERHKAAAPEQEPVGDTVTLREAARDLVNAMHDNQQTVGYRIDLWNCLRDLLDAPSTSDQEKLQGWQLINTAPKEGWYAPILTCCMGEPVAWFGHEPVAGYAEPPSTAYWNEHGDCWTPCQRPHDAWEPTHWMPLLAAPITRAHQTGERS